MVKQHPRLDLSSDRLGGGGDKTEMKKDKVSEIDYPKCIISISSQRKARELSLMILHLRNVTSSLAVHNQFSHRRENKYFSKAILKKIYIYIYHK
jgi:hypothetical protein